MSQRPSEGIDQELFDLERAYWEALKSGDASTAARLSDEPCIVTGAQGVGQLARATLAGMLGKAPWRLEEFTLTNPITRRLTDDVAVIAYNVREVLVVDGQRLTLDAADASTWVRREGRWLCAVHTESLAGDPFGRDRP
ncbi:MAG TPA: nuclear transport factor 2 family protein [Polyangia bacterium]|nr:nuclear transport factor 2 family protein [Polyangia bacterium]